YTPRGDKGELKVRHLIIRQTRTQMLKLSGFAIIALLFGYASLGWSSPASDQTKAAIPEGPEGSAFYTPPQPLPSGTHGDVIRSRNLNNDAALTDAAQNWLLLYRSTDIHGNTIAVSGTVAIPKGAPPEGGWPVISWTHGTTGIADICAP